LEPVDIYARVSRKGDKEQRSTTGQAQVCRAILAERGLPAGQIHIDDGRSAWNPKVSRPGWDTLMARLESGAAGGVIVFDMERFSRRPIEGERLIAAAERGLLVLDSDAEFDLTTSSGKKSFRDAMTAAAYYSDRLHDRTARGKRLKAQAGQVDARRSFGFEQDGTTHRADEVAIIRDHATRLLDGETQDSLIRELRETGVPTVRGAEWGYTTYRQVMTRPRNAGYIVHNGEIVPGVKLPGEPILEETQWRRLVALYTARRRGRQPSGRYVLTGYVLCGLCDSSLGGRPVTGTTRRIYWCKVCKHITVETSRLEEWASDWAIKTLADPEHAEAIERADRELEAKRAALLAEPADIETTLTEIGARLGRREISLTRHDAICNPLEARQAEISQELDALAAETPAPPPPGSRTLAQADPVGQRRISLLADWEDGTPGDRRAMVARALRGRKIVVGPGTSAKFDQNRVSIR
jgi:DNA invertase Pin-like site-specific DNA recombinase